MIVALIALLPEAFPNATALTNFRYYEPRCAHGSSLSAAMHAMVAARLGDDAVLEFAAVVVDGLVRAARVPGDDILLGHRIEPRCASGPILLSSQVYVARALVDVYELP